MDNFYKKLKVVLVVIACVAFIAPFIYSAISTSTLHSNASPGDAGVVKESVYDQDAVPKYPIGAKKSFSDGRVFRYAHFGANTNRGILVSGDRSENSTAATYDAVIAPASANVTTDGTIGSTFVEITLASVTDNQYAGGYFMVNGGTGVGYTYRIRGNNTTGDPASGNFRLELYDPLKVALDATTDFIIVGDLYNNVEGATTSSACDSVICGVSVSTMTVTTAAYGWVQTWGPCAVLCDSTGGAINVGGIVTLSDGVTGAVQLMDAYTEPIVGYLMEQGADTTQAAVYLQVAA